MLRMTKRIALLLMMAVLVCGCLCSCGGEEIDPETAAAIEAACDLADDEVAKMSKESDFDVSGMYVADERSYLIMYMCETDEQVDMVNGWDDKDMEDVLGAAQQRIMPFFDGLKVDVFVSVMNEDYDALVTYVEEGFVLDERD